MSEYTFGRKKIGETPESNMEKLQQATNMQQMIDSEDLSDFHGEKPAPAQKVPGNSAIKGHVPAEFLKHVPQSEQQPSQMQAPRKFTNDSITGPKSDEKFQSLMEGLDNNKYEEIVLPSLGKFYDGTNGPADGKLHIREMTGEEEQILASQRLASKGQSVNMILERCILEKFRAADYLTVDKTYLLIYLRGISYTVEYPVELKCDSCDKTFEYSIMLNELNIEDCPETYGPVLDDKLPKSGYRFSYRLPTGKDDLTISEHRDARIKRFGKNAEDDTILYRSALLLNDIEGISDKAKLLEMLKKLPIIDVNHIRSCTMDIPFGVNTKLEVGCPECYSEFKIELPYESNFFFPRKREKME